MSKQFKSGRAAKQAFTKSENAYEAARKARAEYEQNTNTRLCVEDSDVGEWADNARAVLAEAARLNKAEDEANDASVAIYDSARAQGFFIHSYRLGNSGTKDLISQNID
jgi:hypothetical protein